VRGNQITKCLKVKELAPILGVSRATAYRKVLDGTIPSIRLGDTLRIPYEPFMDWFETQQKHGQHDSEYNGTMKRYLLDRLHEMVLEMTNVIKEVEQWHPIWEDSDGNI
jgi:excisionase family DNA binding protein